MKKLVPILSALFLLICLPAAAAEALPDAEKGYGYALTINTLEQDPAEYYTASNMLYIPLDGYHCALMGLEVTEGQTVAVTRREGGGFVCLPDKTELNGPVTVFDRPVNLNGAVLDGSAFARAGGTLLMPIDPAVISALGLTTEYSGGGLKIYSDSRFEIYKSEPISSGWANTSDSFYVVNGGRAAMVNRYSSHFFSGTHLYIYDGNDFVKMYDEFSDDGLVRFGSFDPQSLEMTDGRLSVTAYTYLSQNNRPYYPDHLSDSYSEKYSVTFDLASIDTPDVKLLEKRNYNTLYRCYEDENGRLLRRPILENIGDMQSIFRYEGGRVILNGTMMRSYSALIYMVDKEDENGRLIAYGGGSDSYWIKVEDLDNYGYNMTPDYENRATYFTRDPSKKITPLGFEGTNEPIPIYPSDWKIFIDGVEPKECYNIGGYTMIKAGELGEWEEGTLDDGYRVLRVTTPDMVRREPKVVGYYSVDVFDEPVDELRTEYLTDVMYAFVIPEQDGRLRIPKPELLKAVVEKAHADGAKVHISIGGWSDGDEILQSRFEAIAADSEKTNRFIEECVWAVRRYELDGIEIDWEHPNDSTAALYEAFMLKICGDKRLPSVSAALCGADSDGYPISAAKAVSDCVANALDFINVMAYDGSDVGHAAYGFAVGSLNYWLGRGIPADRLVLGIPLYARPSMLQYRELKAKGVDILHSDFANIDGQPSFFNSLESIKRKTEYAKANAGGVMFFDIHEDTVDYTSALLAAWDILRPNK